MNKYKGTTKVSLTIRIVVGGYLIYTAMSLFKGIPEAANNDKTVMIVFGALFTIIGILLMVFSGKALIYKQYDDGSNNEEDNKDTIDEIETTENDEQSHTLDGIEDNNNTDSEK